MFEKDSCKIYIYGLFKTKGCLQNYQWFVWREFCKFLLICQIWYLQWIAVLLYSFISVSSKVSIAVDQISVVLDGVISPRCHVWLCSWSDLCDITISFFSPKSYAWHHSWSVSFAGSTVMISQQRMVIMVTMDTIRMGDGVGVEVVAVMAVDRTLLTWWTGKDLYFIDFVNFKVMIGFFGFFLNCQEKCLVRNKLLKTVNIFDVWITR